MALGWLHGLFLRRRRTSRQRTGEAGERHAVAYLRGLGWNIVVRNWRYGRDEVDIVAGDGPNLVFVEVKTRTDSGAVDDSGSGYFAVDKRKRRALARACRAYMRGLERAPQHFRFDIIEVKLRAGAVSALHHHRGVALFSQKR
jgi:putative endonuclease